MSSASYDGAAGAQSMPQKVHGRCVSFKRGRRALVVRPLLPSCASNAARLEVRTLGERSRMRALRVLLQLCWASPVESVRAIVSCCERKAGTTMLVVLGRPGMCARSSGNGELRCDAWCPSSLARMVRASSARTTSLDPTGNWTRARARQLRAWLEHAARHASDHSPEFPCRNSDGGSSVFSERVQGPDAQRLDFQVARVSSDKYRRSGGRTRSRSRRTPLVACSAVLVFRGGGERPRDAYIRWTS